MAGRMLEIGLHHPAPCASRNSHDLSLHAPTQGKNSLSYADAGVDIDAGNSFVDRIKPAVRSTRRRGANAEIGGFGGLFDLKACGFKDPVLVAANDGVGTKLKIAIESGIHAGIGIDLVAMCVNDLVVQGAEPLFFLDYYATGKLDIDTGVAIVEGIAEGCRQAGAALIGGETAEMPGLYRRATMILPVSPSARWSATPFCRARMSRRAMCSLACLPPESIRTASRWYAASSNSPGSAMMPLPL